MSEHALTRVEKQEVLHRSGYSDAQLKVITNTVAQGATFNELALFLHQCKRTGLDPLGRQIHFVKYGQGDRAKVSIQTGIDGLRLIADRTGRYAGNADYTFNGGMSLDEHLQAVDSGEAYYDKYPRTATATVNKLVGDRIVPFTATAAWSQYYPGDGPRGSMWRKMPHLMLGKCAEALALRKAFPAEMSGVYTAEEMDQAQPSSGGLADTIREATAVNSDTNGTPVDDDAYEEAVEVSETDDADRIAFAKGVADAVKVREVRESDLIQAILGVDSGLAGLTKSQLEKIVRVAKMITEEYGVVRWQEFVTWCLENGYSLRGAGTVATAVNDYRRPPQGGDDE